VGGILQTSYGRKHRDVVVAWQGKKGLRRAIVFIMRQATMRALFGIYYRL
jgi:hypothetical protein